MTRRGKKRDTELRNPQIAALRRQWRSDRVEYRNSRIPIVRLKNYVHREGNYADRYVGTKREELSKIWKLSNRRNRRKQKKEAMAHSECSPQ